MSKSKRSGWRGTNIREEYARQIEAVLSKKRGKTRQALSDFAVPGTITAYVNRAVYEKLKREEDDKR